jgi:hypothetical protein
MIIKFLLRIIFTDISASSISCAVGSTKVRSILKMGKKCGNDRRRHSLLSCILVADGAEER